ncbi:hypothetical protein BDU_1107 (plasmid) [Borrelia duttonii Ly]|uniref:Uncharacterized protein n=2 Tax=Borrelia duttonii TaxID=40834 RepID=B5RNG2_BORDL|nr:hypothetical protein BDU_1107 [Borrelia duttonii Ly]
MKLQIYLEVKMGFINKIGVLNIFFIFLSVLPFSYQFCGAMVLGDFSPNNKICNLIGSVFKSATITGADRMVMSSVVNFGFKIKGAIYYLGSDDVAEVISDIDVNTNREVVGEVVGSGVVGMQDENGAFNFKDYGIDIDEVTSEKSNSDVIQNSNIIKPKLVKEKQNNKNLGDDANDTDESFGNISDNIVKFSSRVDKFLGWMRDDSVKWKELITLMQKFYNKKRQEIRKKMAGWHLREPFFVDQNKGTVHLCDTYVVDMKGDNIKIFLDDYSEENSSDWSWACIRFFAREFLFALTAFGNNYDKIYEHLKTFFEGSILESALKDSFKK